VATPLRVLLVEDCPADARLLADELRKADFAASIARVETEEEFLAQLTAELDVILCDYSLPGFDALRAIELVGQHGLDIPLVIVSGAVPEETIVAAVRAGAWDYLLKDRLARLGDAIRTALAHRQLSAEHRRVEEVLREVQMRTRVILDTANDPYVEMDSDGRIIEWNAQAEVVFGWSRDEVLGRLMQDVLVPAADRAAHSEGLRHYLATGQSQILNSRIEVSASRRDGGHVPVELLVWPVRAAGSLTFSAVLRDITAQKQFEVRLVERARLAALQADVGLALTQCDSLGEMLRQSAASVVRNLDAAAVQIWTVTDATASPELAALAGECQTPPDSHLAPAGNVPSVLAIALHGRPFTSNEVRAVQGQDESGEGQPPVASFAGYPLFVEQRLVGVITILGRHPLTPAVVESLATVANQIALGIERKRTESSIRATNAILQSLIEASPLAIVTIDRNHQVLMWNPAAERLFGWDADEVIGKPSPFLQPGDDGRVESLIAEEFSGRRSFGRRLQRRRKAGAPVDVSLWTAPLRDSNGEVVAALGMHADMTEQNHLEDQIRQAQKMEAIGRLAGGVAHDFNNMLTIILGYADILRGCLGESDSLAEPVEAILDAARKAADLTRQLLAFSRKQLLRPRVVRLDAAVEGMKKMLFRLIGEQITHVLRLDPHTGRVLADVGQLEQVVLNLVINARDAMPDGGTLTIETSNERIADSAVAGEVPPGDYVVLSITDTGHGMDEATRLRAFEPFFTTKEPGKGTGLGLATVYGIVRQSGGFVTVDSQPQRGAKFQVYLPRAQKASESTQSLAPVSVTPNGRETVLVVEDEQPVRQLAAAMLRRQGYRVIEAEDGAEALSIAERHEGPIEMLVTDVVMPQMNGCQLAQRLHSTRPTMKVLYVSGYADSALLPAGIVQDGLPILQKPFTTDELARRVRGLLDQDSAGSPPGKCRPASRPGDAASAKLAPLAPAEDASAIGTHAVDEIIPAIVTAS
jgi:two-component system, cell cycle sensor histidine kinase and response regulator CckA